MGTRFNPSGGSYTSADIYGRRPDPVTLADPAADLERAYPNLKGTNAALSEEILRMIQGTDPNLPILAKNTGAARGAALGLSGSEFADRMGDLSLYDRRAAQRQQGISNYNATVPTISATQTNSPALQAQTQAQNNIWASAPDPAAAAQEALRLYQEQLGNLSRSYSAPSVSTPSRPTYSLSMPQASAPSPVTPQASAPRTSAAAPAVQDYQNWFNTYGSGGGFGNTPSASSNLMINSDSWWDMPDNPNPTEVDSLWS